MANVRIPVPIAVARRFTTVVGAIGAVLSAAAIAAAPDPAAQPKPTADSDPFPITVTIDPAIVLATRAGAATSASPARNGVTVSGRTLPAGQRPVTIVVADAGGSAVSTATAAPDAKGGFRALVAAPDRAGTYTLTATAPDGRGTAHGTFRAVEPSGLGPQAETADQAAVDAAAAATDAVEKQVDAQVDSPPKAEAKKKIAALKKALGELRARPAGPALNGTIGAIASNAALMESKRSGFEAVTKAVADTTSETERVRALTAQMSAADTGCHQLAFVTEVFKGISALLNVKKKLLDTSIGLARDVVSDATANQAKNAGANPALAFVAGQVAKNLPELDSASKLSGNAVGILADVGAFVSDTLFARYCEQFTGPLDAIMNARFFTPSRTGGGPTEWWSYNYKLTGRVILYYPKSAKNAASIRLHGRIEGYAHSFETTEDALTVMFPKLMAGAIQKKYNFPPIEAGAGASSIASQGSSPMSAYVEGSAAGLLVPNSFLIDVEGVLEKDSLTIVLGKARADIDAVHRVAVLILSPLTGGLGPQVTWYPLGFQKARSYLVNAADGESMKLKLETSGDRMTALNVFEGKVDKPKVNARYTLKIKVCNPGC